MFRNYLTVAFRNLVRHKVYSFINISGLAIGMTCCVLILIFARFELGYDAYHENADRIYRIAHERGTADGRIVPSATSPPPLAPVLRNEYPEVVHAVRFVRGTSVIRYGNNRFRERLFFTDASVFDVFDFPLVKGDAQTALREPFSVILTEMTARKYFGHEDPLGKVLTFETPVVQHDYKVTGVIQEVPHNSHFRFGILASYESLHEDDGTSAILKNWLSNPVLYTYLLLPQDCSPAELERKLPALIKKYMGEASAARGQVLRLFLQPLTSIHLYSHLNHEVEPNSDVVHVYLFAALACFVLLIACINFMNLSTARSARRAKEVGIRKVTGANRLQLIRQFLGESTLLAFIALLVAAALVEISLPLFSRLVDQPLAVDYGNLSVPFGLVGVALITGIVAGSYPAFFLSAFQPAAVLKGTLNACSKTSRFRQVLVTVQFAISTTLIISMGIIYAQMDYVRNKSLGFEKAHVIALPIFRHRDLRSKYELVKAELLQSPDILSCAVSSDVPLRSTPGFPLRRWPAHPEGAPGELQVPGYSVDQDFWETLGITLVAGRNFSKGSAADETEAVIVNETAVRRFGWASSEEALGKGLVLRNRKRGTIIGVVKDFHVQSLYQQIEPLIFRISPSSCNNLLVRIRPNRSSSALDLLKREWETYVPSSPFEYAFLDEYFDRQYRTDERRGKMLGGFTVLAIFIACLGLFGLVSFAAEQRTKEIGIRKALGATASNIVLLLSKDFARPVILANVIAWPIAYYAMNNWLQNFAYRIDLGMGTFVLGGMLALAIALVTVSYQAIKAALANPVDALRYE